MDHRVKIGRIYKVDYNASINPRGMVGRIYEGPYKEDNYITTYKIYKLLALLFRSCI